MIFFQHFTVKKKKTRFPLPAESLFCLYIQWFAYMDAICKVGLWENVSSHRNFLCPAGDCKGFRNRL